MELLVESKRLWAELSEAVGADLGYQRNGYIAPCTDDQASSVWQEWLKGVATYEPEAQILDAEAARQHVPAAIPWSGAYFNPSDGCAEPTMSTSAIATAAQNLGATIVESCAVRGLERSAGHVSAVVTELGNIQASTVILAAGAWPMLFARSIGVELPILGIDAPGQSVAPVTDVPPGYRRFTGCKLARTTGWWLFDIGYRWLCANRARHVQIGLAISAGIPGTPAPLGSQNTDRPTVFH